MSESQLFLGTSAWTADGWVGSFSPPNSQPADFLPWYAQHFNSVEIDCTFYRIPTAKMAEQRRERTPEGFIFAAKVPQTVTHEKVVQDADDDLKAFLKVMDLLGDKLGPLLFQFPYFNRQKFRGVDFSWSDQGRGWPSYRRATSGSSRSETGIGSRKNFTLFCASTVSRSPCRSCLDPVQQ